MNQLFSRCFPLLPVSAIIGRFRIFS
jgi:hypothetical protein